MVVITEHGIVVWLNAATGIKRWFIIKGWFKGQYFS